MESLITHTLSRSIEANDQEITHACSGMGDEIKGKAVVTYGQDSSSHQKRFNQQLDINPDDSQLFVVSVNFVAIIAEDGKEIFLNPAPHSSRSVRPQKIFYGKEDEETNCREYQKSFDAMEELKEKEFRFVLSTGNLKISKTLKNYVKFFCRSSLNFEN
jgi:hypothetical protein